MCILYFRYFLQIIYIRLAKHGLAQHIIFPEGEAKLYFLYN